MASSITKELKEYYYSMYDEHANRRVKEVGQLANRKISSERLDILECLFKYIMDSESFSVEFKLYIQNRDWTLERVKERLEDSGKKISLNAVSGKVMYDKRKIEALIGRKFLYNVIEGREDDVIRSKNDLAIIIGDQVAVKKLISISMGTKEVRSKYEGDFIGQYGELIKEISAYRQKELEDKVQKDREFTGYMNMLLSGIPLNDEKAEEDRRKVMMILHGDYTSLKNSDSGVVSVEETVSNNVTDENSNVKVTREQYGDIVF